MTMGALPGQRQGRPPVMAFESDIEPPSSLLLPTLLQPVDTANSSSGCPRPFFWEIVPLCDLYSIAHIVVLPTPLRLSYSPTPPSSGSSNANGVDNVNGHLPSNMDPSARLIDALAKLGLGPSHWSAAGVSIFTAILPSPDGGYVHCSDFLRLRLQDFPFPISKIRECVDPLKQYTACRLASASMCAGEDVASVINQSAGVIQWSGLHASVSVLDLQNYLLGLTEELRSRLNHAPWLTPFPIPRKRVALLRGRPDPTAGGPVYRAARELGLDLVIIDDDGHWLQPDTDENRMRREAFLATDMTEDMGVVSRIVESISRYALPIHGVFTLSDNFFVTAARVAEALGLPSNPVTAFEISVDKHRSRLLQDVAGHTARVTNVDELNSLLSAGSEDDHQFKPAFPMIVKPTKGWSSECVSKVNHVSELAQAVQKATSRHGSAAVIEPFFDGPEIDVNFVLLDGEILFCEIADEPPSQADASTASVDATFSPEALTLPSALPEDEQQMAKTEMCALIRKAGFQTGVFHVEARIIRSRSEYRDDGDGVIDLMAKKGDTEHTLLPTEKKAACKLIEINARPPGYRVTVPSRHTYGVDYFAAQMLAAVGDHDRLRLVARPFDHVHEGRSRGAQYWSRLVYVPATKEGVVRWPQGLSPCEELRARRDDLKEGIIVAVDYYMPGDRVELHTNGVKSYVAHLLVCSRVSRKHAIQVGEEVLRAFRIEVQEEDGDGK